MDDPPASPPPTPGLNNTISTPASPTSSYPCPTCTTSHHSLNLFAELNLKLRHELSVQGETIAQLRKQLGYSAQALETKQSELATEKKSAWTLNHKFEEMKLANIDLQKGVEKMNGSRLIVAEALKTLLDGHFGDLMSAYAEFAATQGEASVQAASSKQKHRHKDDEDEDEDEDDMPLAKRRMLSQLAEQRAPKSAPSSSSSYATSYALSSAPAFAPISAPFSAPGFAPSSAPILAPNAAPNAAPNLATFRNDLSLRLGAHK